MTLFISLTLYITEDILNLSKSFGDQFGVLLRRRTSSKRTVEIGRSQKLVLLIVLLLQLS